MCAILREIGIALLMGLAALVGGVLGGIIGFVIIVAIQWNNAISQEFAQIVFVLCAFLFSIAGTVIAHCILEKK